MSDEVSLIRRAQDGDAQALGELYETHFNRVYRYAFVKVRNVGDAEDITQQVFLKVMRSLGSYQQRGAPLIAWLLRIAHNEVIDYFRKKGRVKTVPIDERLDTPELDRSAVDPSAIAEKELELEKVMAVVDKLPPAQRDVIMVRFVSGLSIAESAQTLRKSEGTVKALQFNAVANLRRLVYGGRNDGKA